jgi:hypothetical protein
MQFSLRSLLAVLLLCGVLFPLVMGLQQVRRDEATRMQLANEIVMLRQSLAIDDPKRQRFDRHVQEEYDSLRRLRKTAELHFAGIQEKYGTILPRGPNVLSLRVVPQLSLDGTPSPLVFRVLVPERRQVWLKYAVILKQDQSVIPKWLDQLARPSVDTGFLHNGFYQVRLRPGQRDIVVRSGPVAASVLPIAVRLDDQALLKTRFEADGRLSLGASHLGGLRQIDYDPQRELPWLVSLKLDVNRKDGSYQNSEYECCLWLSERSSGFDAFPESRENR